MYCCVLGGLRPPDPASQLASPARQLAPAGTGGPSQSAAVGDGRRASKPSPRQHGASSPERRALEAEALAARRKAHALRLERRLDEQCDVASRHENEAKRVSNELSRATMIQQTLSKQVEL